MTTSSLLKDAPAFAKLAERARATIATHGWPTSRLEGFRYTSLRGVAELASDDAPPLDAYSVDGSSGDVRIEPLATALQRDDVAADFGSVAEIDTAEAALVAFNTDAVQGGLVIDVAAGADATLALSLGGARWPRLLIRVGRGARLRLRERWTDPATLTAPVTEIRLSDAAVCEHLVLQDAPTDRRILATVAVDVGRDARYEAHVVQLGAALGRIALPVALRGDGSHCSLSGLLAGAGTQHLDAHVVVDHIGQHTRSEQHFKGLFGDAASGVFRGNVRIAREARFADAQQMNRNLLLSERARAHAKPQLEIDNEDVKASHGATVGQLDANQLFYLRSRGIPESVARDLLVQAFADEIVAALPDAALAETVRGVLRGRLAVAAEVHA
ncbi:MAG: Fe-S cluster assembly protein SufD [Deltaproteobacteria bacterium]|nr:Fe-S cluster assembly protein SufD [Deltaproteobacteria bacterium]